MSDLRIIRGASPSRHGGIHWYEWKPKDEARIGPAALDLLLLHPMGKDGTFFSTIAPFLAAGRTVIAAEYPGNGRSDPFNDTPTIGTYADAMIDMVRARNTLGRVDLFGFQAGCLVVAELSLRYPDVVHRQVQVNVPFFNQAKRQEMLAKDWAVGGFIAAFNYPSEERFFKIKHDTLVIATDSVMLDTSRAAARAIRKSELLEFPEVNPPALENGAAVISNATLEFLDR